MCDRENGVTLPFPQREVRVLHGCETCMTIAAGGPGAADRAAAIRVEEVPTN